MMKMKKFAATILAATMALSLAACGGSASSAPAAGSTSEPAAAPNSAANEEYAQFTGATIDAIKKAGKLVVGTEAQYAPFEFMDANGEFVGCDMWLAQQVADALGVKLEIVDMAFDGIIPAVKANQVDIGIAAFSTDPERAKEIDFSKVYQKDAQVLLVKKGNEKTYTTKESLKGQQLGAQRGTVQSKVITAVFPESQLFELDKWPTLALEVINGNIAGIVVDGAVADNMMSEHKELVAAEFDFSGEDIDVGKAAVLAKGKDDLLALVDAVVENVTADGSFQAAYDEAVALSKTLGI